MKILIVGCGYVGSEFARQWLGDHSQESHELYALTRSAERERELLDLGVQPIVADWLDADSIPSLPSIDGLLVAVPHRPDESLGTATHVVGLTNVLSKLQSSQDQPAEHCTPRIHLVYLSTTGVYGQVAADQVDETTAVSPSRPGPQIAVETEQWLESHQAQLQLRQLTILRLAGIYGAGRIPLIRSLLAGEPLAVPRDGHLNLIHVVDIGRLLVRIFESPPRDTLYVASDGQPVLRETFYGELARLCGVAEPQFVSPAPDDTRVRRATDKRVNPTKLFTHLGLQPLFSDYRAGLAQVVAAERE